MWCIIRSIPKFGKVAANCKLPGAAVIDHETSVTYQYISLGMLPLTPGQTQRTVLLALQMRVCAKRDWDGQCSDHIG